MVRRSPALWAGAVLFLAAVVVAAADPLPVAPPPREAKPAKPKTAAELLVGTWRLVEFDRFKFPADGPIAVFTTYTADGKVLVRVIDEKKRPPVPGTYRLDGDWLFQSLEATTDQEATAASLIIVELTDRELVVDSQNGPFVERGRYTRVLEQKK
jgi:uncharacterized protein (TIGR03066 family)